jgi:hypothetical protein
VQFPSGTTRNVNMIVLLAETRNAEYRARFGRALAPNAPGIRELRTKYELDWFFDGPVRTWEDAASVMRHFHGVCLQHVRDSRGS